MSDMLSNGFVAPLHLRLKPSRSLYSLRWLAHLLALVAVLLAGGLPLPIQVGILILLTLSILLTVKRQQAEPHMYELSWRPAQGWQEQGHPVAASSSNETGWPTHQALLINPWFVCFRLVGPGKTKTHLLMADQFSSKDDFRRLRVLLRFYREGKVPRREGEIQP